MDRSTQTTPPPTPPPPVSARIRSVSGSEAESNRSTQITPPPPPPDPPRIRSDSGSEANSDSESDSDRSTLLPPPPPPPPPSLPLVCALSDSDSTSLEEIVVQETEKPTEYNEKSSVKLIMYTAAENLTLEELKTRLEKCDPFEKDSYKKTMLHYACGIPLQKAALEMSEAILIRVKAKATTKKMRETFVDSQDVNGDTALHIAARLGHLDVVNLLVNKAGARLDIRNKDKVAQIKLIYEMVPCHMTEAYDAAVTCKEGGYNDQNLTLMVRFKAICGAAKRDADKPPEFHRETYWLSNCLELSYNKQKDILTHPVVKLFLHLKWKKIRALLWLSILYHILWLTFYTYFNVNLHMVICPYQYETKPNSTQINISCKPGNQYTRLIADVCVLLLMTILVALKELYEIHQSRQFKMYFKEPENIGQLLVMGIVVLTCIPVILGDKEEMSIPDWQYQVSAFGILLACFLCLSQIGKIPRFGIYMLILAKVVKSFAMFIITFAAILVAFMLSFQILMPEKEEFNDGPWSLIRVLSMMSGEINYDNYAQDDPTDSKLPFPISTKLLFAAFIAIVTMILCNLLIGLTVSDIQSLQSEAELHSLSIQVDGIFLMESFLMSHSMQTLLRKFGKHSWLRYFLVTQQNDNPKTSLDVDVRICEIPKYLQSDLRNLAAKNSDKEECVIC